MAASDLLYELADMRANSKRVERAGGALWRGVTAAEQAALVAAEPLAAPPTTCDGSPSGAVFRT